MRRLLIVLLGMSLALPALAAALVVTARLLAAMHDDDGAIWLDRLGILSAGLWAGALVVLLLTLAFRAVLADESARVRQVADAAPRSFVERDEVE